MAIDPNQLQYQWRSYFGDNPDAQKRTYSIQFSAGGQDYTFIPSSVISNGAVGRDATAVLPWFLNQDNLKQFAQTAQPIDLSGVSWYGDYLKDTVGSSTDGFLIPAGSLPFDSVVKAYNNADIGTIKGMSQDAEGNLQYITTGSHPDQNGYGNISTDGQLHNHWVEQSGGFGGVLGDFFGGINDLMQSAGPVLPIMANLISPGLGTAITMGQAIGSGNIENAAKNYAISQAVGQSGISGDVAAATGSQAAGQFTAGTLGALAAGQNLDTALTNAAIGTAATQGTQAVNQAATEQQLTDWSQQQAQKAYENAPSPTEQDVLAADPNVALPENLSTQTTATGPGYYDETTGAWISDPNGPLQAPLTDKSGTNIDSMSGYEYDPETQTWTAPDGTTYDMSYLSNSGEAVSGSDLLEPPSDEPPESFDPTMMPSGFARAALNSMFGGSGSAGGQQQQEQAVTYDPITGQPSGKVTDLASQGQLNPLLFSLAGFPSPKHTEAKNPFSDLALGTSGFAPSTGGANVDPFADLSVASSIQAPEQQPTQTFAQGGLASAHPAGEPQFYSEGGLNNRYIKGEGDGTSDSIPAMVADSEFVMPADVVAALGNGSSDAGAEKLDQMVEQIRKRARSTAPSELPPTAHESPLDYLKGRA